MTTVEIPLIALTAIMFILGYMAGKLDSNKNAKESIVKENWKG